MIQTISKIFEANCSTWAISVMASTNGESLLQLQLAVVLNGPNYSLLLFSGLRHAAFPLSFSLLQILSCSDGSATDCS